MIDFVRGTVAYIETDYAVIDVGHIGYQVFVSNPYELAGRVGSVTLYTHQHVREDAILLYGFLTREERSLFRRLLDVSGIGPKVALGILTGGRPEQLVAAIQREDLAYLTKLPGVGKKTAQRIVLDLKDKLNGFSEVFALEPVAAVAAERTPTTPWEEARQGLIALGYTETEADRAWSIIRERVQEDESVESLMKKALQALFSS